MLLVLLPRDELLQNFLCVFEALGNLRIVTHQLIRQVVGVAVALLVHVGNVTLIRGQQHFGVIVKDDLHRVVAEAEEDCVLGAYPFLQVDERLPRADMLSTRRQEHVLIVGFLLLLNQIIAKVLQKRDFLLQLIRKTRQCVRNDDGFTTTHHVCCRLLTFNVLEAFPIRLQYGLGRVIEIDTRAMEGKDKLERFDHSNQDVRGKALLTFHRSVGNPGHIC